MSGSLSTLQCLQPLLAPAHGHPSPGCVVHVAFGQHSGRLGCIVKDYGAVACRYLVKLAPLDGSSFGADDNAAHVLPPPAAAAAHGPQHCRLDAGMFEIARGAIAVGHSVELQQQLDMNTAKALLRVGCKVRLKGGARCGVVTSISARCARVQLRPAGGTPQSTAAAARCDEVDAAIDDIILRIKGTVSATRVRDTLPHAAAPAPPPSPSFEVQVRTAGDDCWVEPFFVSVVLKPRQMQTLGHLSAMSSAPGPDNSLQSACARGDAALLQAVLSSSSNPNPSHFSPLITVLACNGSVPCITALLRSGCDPLKSYPLNLDDLPRGAHADSKRDALPSRDNPAVAPRPSSSYSQAVAARAKKLDAAPLPAPAHDSGVAAAAVPGVAENKRVRVYCALDAAAYYGMLPAFKVLLAACKRKLTLHHSKSCAAAAAAADQLIILQQLLVEVISDADEMFWPEAAAVAAASDHWSCLHYILSSSTRCWTLPLDCSLSPCARSNILHVAASHRSTRVLAACCDVARASPPPQHPRIDAQSFDPWSKLFRSLDCNGCNPLHVAVGSGCSHVVIAAMVAYAGDTLDARDGRGRSVLHTACDNMHAECVKMLLSIGASRTLKDNTGLSAAALAVQACDVQQSVLTDPKARAVLHQRCLGIIKLLFETRHPTAPPHSSAAVASSLMSESSSGDPLIVAAARAGIDDVVAYLLDLDPSCARARGRSGQSVLDVYLSSKSSRGLDLLQQRALLSAMDYASAPRRNAGFNPAHTLKPFWQVKH